MVTSDWMTTKLFEHRVWVRFAGNVANIKGTDPYHWRCFINKTGKEIPLLEWGIVGHSSGVNFIPGTNSESEENGLFAWIDVFGDIDIANGIATVSLLSP